ncbi:hypothetical protein [Planomicrobium okeanokoites]|uniref:hypothetical protein n=1 Tax=Planomicrobium okeanokoites TaxID=244 RepID=UPI000A068066|nr:hypothetical protein [Planomicrobium okeanokoites]
MYSLFDLVDEAKEEKAIVKQPKEIVYQEHSDTTFHPNLADWKAIDYMPGVEKCEVIGYIPETVLSPTNKRGGRSFTSEWNARIEIWTAYVHALTADLTKDNISTYWLEAVRKLDEAREQRTPVRLKIDKFYCERFIDLEVVEYISATKGSVSND